MAGVLYVHFWGNVPPGLEDLRVGLFFMLSGFLITRILLGAKTHRRRYTALAFVTRRGLRLLPPLYIALAVARLFDMDDIRRSFLWHVFQLSNVHFIVDGKWHPWVTAHLWSLNVVEQFYFAWLGAFLLLPRRLILPAAIALTLFAWP